MRKSLPSHTADRRLWEIQPLRDFAALLTIVAAVWLLYDLRHALAPVLIALVLAYACDPLIQAASARGLARWVSALVLTLILVAGTTLLLTWLGPSLVGQVKTLGKNIPQYVSVVEEKYGVHVGGVSEQLANFAKGVKEAPIRPD
jgi:predicted PurR-regulated permease PerM